MHNHTSPAMTVKELRDILEDAEIHDDAVVHLCIDELPYAPISDMHAFDDSGGPPGVLLLFLNQSEIRDAIERGMEDT